MGKWSDSDYRLVSAWIRRDTYDRMTRRLFVKENRREFCEWVQSLLEDWLKQPADDPNGVAWICTGKTGGRVWRNRVSGFACARGGMFSYLLQC